MTQETFDQMCDRLAGELLLAIGRGTPARTIIVMQAQHILAWRQTQDAKEKKV